MTHGELVKKLRRERGLSQTQLANNISTRTTLSSFENNRSRVSAEILFKYLERMNVSIQEYLFYFNKSSENEKELATQYFYDEVVKQKDIEIEKRILDYQSKYKDSHDFYFCCLSIELKLFLNRRRSTPLFDVDEDMEIIKHYLEKVQQWGHFELSIFSNCLYIFSSEYIHGTYFTLLKKTKILSAVDTYQNDLAIFLNNCIVLSFERKQFQDVKFYCQQLYTVSGQTPRKAYDRMMYAYYTELLKADLHQPNHVSQTIQQFRNLGFAEHADELEVLRKQTCGLKTGSN